MRIILSLLYLIIVKVRPLIFFTLPNVNASYMWYYFSSTVSVIQDDYTHTTNLLATVVVRGGASQASCSNWTLFCTSSLSVFCVIYWNHKDVNIVKVMDWPMSVSWRIIMLIMLPLLYIKQGNLRNWRKCDNIAFVMFLVPTIEAA